MSQREWMLIVGGIVAVANGLFVLLLLSGCVWVADRVANAAGATVVTTRDDRRLCFRSDPRYRECITGSYPPGAYRDGLGPIGGRLNPVIITPGGAVIVPSTGHVFPPVQPSRRLGR